jgi:DNA invertase Pin-like site-specific DNA recombinase
MSVAQCERETIQERTTEAMHHLRDHGRHNGGETPYGFAVAADGKMLVAEAGEQALLDAIRNVRQRGRSQRAVVGEPTRQGFTT